MNHHCLRLTAALASALLSPCAMSQVSAPAPSAAASASPAGQPGPKQLTPQQSRESATAPGDLRPEHATVPQINIPFGKKAALPKQEPIKPARGSNAASAAGIDDAVARCEAEPDRQVRANCRARLAREGRSR
jgi:hypothetical protein